MSGQTSFDSPYRDGLPGWKGTDTSREAAEAVAATVAEKHRKLLAAFAVYGPMTPDTAGQRAGVRNPRPRCSELKRNGKLHGTGKREKNASGMSAEVLSIDPTVIQGEVAHG